MVSVSTIIISNFITHFENVFSKRELSLFFVVSKITLLLCIRLQFRDVHCQKTQLIKEETSIKEGREHQRDSLSKKKGIIETDLLDYEIGIYFGGSFREAGQILGGFLEKAITRQAYQREKLLRREILRKKSYQRGKIF